MCCAVQYSVWYLPHIAQCVVLCSTKSGIYRILHSMLCWAVLSLVFTVLLTALNLVILCLYICLLYLVWQRTTVWYYARISQLPAVIYGIAALTTKALGVYNVLGIPVNTSPPVDLLRFCSIPVHHINMFSKNIGNWICLCELSCTIIFYTWLWSPSAIHSVRTHVESNIARIYTGLWQRRCAGVARFTVYCSPDISRPFRYAHNNWCAFSMRYVLPFPSSIWVIRNCCRIPKVPIAISNSAPANRDLWKYRSLRQIILT